MATSTNDSIILSHVQDIVDTIRSLLKAAHSSECIIIFPLTPPSHPPSPGGGTLRVEKIFDHVLSVLDHRHLCLWMGGDYSHMLLNNVLSCPQYLLDTPPTSWTGENNVHDVDRFGRHPDVC